jgi:hypothetical protein
MATAKNRTNGHVLALQQSHIQNAPDTISPFVGAFDVELVRRQLWRRLLSIVSRER